MIADAKARIIEKPDRIRGVLSEMVGSPPEARIEKNAINIAKHFASDTLEDIIASLDAGAKDNESEWAAKERDTIGTKSPQTLKVALRQLAESAKLTDFADNMRMEYRIGSRVLLLPDFAEGVRAVIVDKTHDPKWDPATPEGVTDELIDSIFAPLPADEEWKVL
jgi:enoyl-CoA hydratase